MTGWRLLDMGAIDGFTMTNLYEAVGRAVSSGEVPNTLLLNHPAAPFANIGYHQQVDRELDVAYCREKEIPIVRRTLGGGAILDGPWEQDYFVVISRDDPECPTSVSEFYAKFLDPVVASLEVLGIDAEFRPVNDILVNDRKISGNGAVTIEGCMVLAGDVLLDVPADLMSRILRVPDEKFRDKMVRSMREWMTSVKEVTGDEPDRGVVKSGIIESFGERLGIDLEKGRLTTEEGDALDRLVTERRTEEWIHRKMTSHERLYGSIGTDGVKIRGGAGIVEATVKADKLLRVTMEIVDDRIRDISISGDFFTVPYIGAVEGLEGAILDSEVDPDALACKIDGTVRDMSLDIVGFETSDLVEAICSAYEKMR